MRYYIYQPSQIYTFFVGTDKEQIKKTIEYYKKDRANSQLEVPSDEEIKEISKLEITCAFPMLKVNHFIEAEISEGIILRVNANAFDYIRLLSQDIENSKRGELYKFNPGMPHIDGMYLLPEQVMKGLEKYPWDKHSEQIDDWLEDREKVIKKMEEKGMFYRH
jgi:hypothetical protein